MNASRTFAAVGCGLAVAASLAACTPNASVYQHSGSLGSTALGSAVEIPPSERNGSSNSSPQAKQAYYYLGYGEVPSCPQLAVIASRRYYAEYTEYMTDLSYDEAGEKPVGTYASTSKAKEASNYLDNAFEATTTFSDGSTSYEKTVMLEGKVVSVNGSKQYFEDETGVATHDEGTEDLKKRVAKNELDAYSSVFLEKGKGKLPAGDDENEYTYYEFSYRFGDEAESLDLTGTYLKSRVYVKADGGLLATYSYNDEAKLADGKTVTIGDLKVYSKVESSIPQEFLEFPDTTGYEEIG